jgi:hypothetical protein
MRRDEASHKAPYPSDERNLQGMAKCHCSHILPACAYENDQQASGSIPDESPSHAALRRAVRILDPSCLHTRVDVVPVAVERRGYDGSL